MGNEVVLRIEKNDGVPIEQHLESERQFCLFYIDQGGCPRILGKLPWARMRSPLHRFLKDWAAKQDLKLFLANFRQKFPETSTELFIAKSRGFQGGPGEKPSKRDDRILLNILSEIMKAIGRKLVNYGMEQLHWEIESLPDDGGIYRTLVEGGHDAEDVYHN